MGDDAKMRREQLICELLAELGKPEPNYTMLKMLRAEIMQIPLSDVSDNTVEVGDNSVLAEQVEPAVPIQASTPMQTTQSGQLATSIKLNEPVQVAAPIVSDSNGVAVNTGFRGIFDGLSLGLYMGSLLILAGIGGLVASGAGLTALPLLIIMTLLFYVGGMMMRKSQRLKMASYTFVGTGMAMVPFIGVLVHNVCGGDPNLIWLLTSIVAIPIYAGATYVMKSEILSYFMIAGVASLASSMASIFSAAISWCFIAVILVGVLCDFLSITGVTKRFKVINRSIRRAGKWLALATLIASTVASSYIGLPEYAAMLSIVMVQLIIDVCKEKDLLSENLLRAVLIVWAIVLANTFSNSLLVVSISMSGVVLAEMCYSVLRVLIQKKRFIERDQAETIWSIVLMILGVVAGCLIGAESGKNAIWAGAGVALLIDTAIAIFAMKRLGGKVWYVVLDMIWLFLPISILEANTGAINSVFNLVLWLCLLLYLIELVVVEVLTWKLEDVVANRLVACSAGLFATVACSIALLNGRFGVGGYSVVSLIMAIVAICVATRGILKKQKLLQELAIYLLTAAIGLLILRFNTVLTPEIANAMIAHVIFAGFLSTSLIVDEPENRVRLAIGNGILLIMLGSGALIYTAFTMVLFLVEAVATLIYGLIFQYKTIWVMGMVGIVAAVFWFTKDLPYVWTVLLGLTVIAVVVITLIRRQK